MIPNADLAANDDVLTGFSMNFTYNSINSSTPEKHSQTQRNALTVRVYINAGKIGA